MHEFSLVQALMGQLDELAREHGKNHVVRVTMEIGPLAGVVIDSFRFGFEALAPESPLTKGAELVIMQPGVNYRCLDCEHEELKRSKRPVGCPECGSNNLFPNGGDELILQQVEME